MGQLDLNYSATHNQIVNMKFLVLSAAQLVTYPNGAVVPVDTAEVAAAKAAHFGAHGLPLAYAGYAYARYPYGLVGHANGAVVPVDEPAVLAAKAQHAAAGGAIHPSGALGYAYGHPYAGVGYAYGYNGYPYAGLVAHPNGAVVPAEPAELVAARAEHLAAHAAAQEPDSLL